MLHICPLFRGNHLCVNCHGKERGRKRSYWEMEHIFCFPFFLVISTLNGYSDEKIKTKKEISKRLLFPCDLKTLNLFYLTPESMLLQLFPWRYLLRLSTVCKCSQWFSPFVTGDVSFMWHQQRSRFKSRGRETGKYGKMHKQMYLYEILSHNPKSENVEIRWELPKQQQTNKMQQFWPLALHPHFVAEMQKMTHPN